MSEQKKPKFQEGDVVVLTSMYPDGSDNSIFSDGELELGKEYTVKWARADTYDAQWCPSSIRVSLEGAEFYVCESMLTLASEYYANKEQQTNNERTSLDNTKINVQAYAEQYEITLEQANKEIQTWLLSNDCSWANGDTCVLYPEEANFLYVNKRSRGLTLTKSNAQYEDYFNDYKAKEIFLERNILLTIKKEPDTIEIEGKKYLKEEVLKAIEQLEQI